MTQVLPSFSSSGPIVDNSNSGRARLNIRDPRTGRVFRVGVDLCCFASANKQPLGQLGFHATLLHMLSELSDKYRADEPTP